VSFFTAELVVKRLELLHELLPKATGIALIVNPSGPTAESQLRIAKEPPLSLGQQVRVVNATTTQEIDSVFATFAHHRPDALIVGTDPVFNARREQFALAARYAVPTVYEGREAVMAMGRDFPSLIGNWESTPARFSTVPSLPIFQSCSP